MKTSFTVEKLDDINIKKFGIILKNYKNDVFKILDKLFEIKELNSSKIFSENINKITFDVAFCSDETIKQINNQYRNKNKTTDVITFSLFADDDNAIIYRKTASLGQIIISLETALKQAKESNNSLRYELLTLTCHGILHLFGFDHLTKKDYDFIVSVQNKVIGEL